LKNNLCKNQTAKFQNSKSNNNKITVCQPTVVKFPKVIYVAMTISYRSKKNVVYFSFRTALQLPFGRPVCVIIKYSSLLSFVL